MKGTLTRSAIVGLAILMVSSLLSGQTTKQSKKAFQSKKTEAVALYQALDLAEAEIAAKEALSMAVGIYGSVHFETALINDLLGDIYEAQGKYNLALASFGEAIEIIGGKGSAFEQQLETISKVLKILKVTKDREAGNKILTEQLAIVADQFGKESVEVLRVLELETDFFLRLRDYESVDSSYLKRYLLTRNLLGKKSATLEDLADEHQCYCIENFSGEEANRKTRAFSNKTAELFSDEVETFGSATLSKESKESQSKEGRSYSPVRDGAISMPKPSYSVAARIARAKGAVHVRIVISKSGSVLSAKAFCGNPLLRQSATEAAMQAKFRPTHLDGKPVEVTGTIIYNFQ